VGYDLAVRTAVPALFLIALASALAAEPPTWLADDRGLPLTSPVEACFTVELTTRCTPWTPGNPPVEPPSGYSALRIEGEDYGPLHLRPADLAKAPQAPLRVPRKALLTVSGRGEGPLRLALYPLSDPDLRLPSVRVEVPRGGKLKVPAGRWVLWLGRNGRAPDLHRLEAPAGGALRVAYRPRRGWSAVVRVVHDGPVAESAVTLQEIVGYGVPNPAPRKTTSDSAGIALFSGLTGLFAEVETRHREYVAKRESGLAAAPGTFEVRTVRLNRGGTLAVSVRLDGEPATTTLCRLISYPAGDPGQTSVGEISAETRVDAQGKCRFERLAEGPVTLRLVPRSTESGHFETSARVIDEQETSLEIDLEEYRISGRVTRHDEPLPEYSVRAFLLERSGPRAVLPEPAFEVTTDVDGRYQGHLWKTGTYLVQLVDRTGAPAGGFRRTIVTGNETIDFDLGGGLLTGTVTDDMGASVAGARVAFTWEGDANSVNTLLSGLRGRMQWAVETDAAGRFGTLLEPRPGSGSLKASKNGFLPSESLAISLGDDEPAPISIVLRRAPMTRVRLVRPSGAPVVGAWLAAFPHPAIPRRIDGRTDADGRAELGFEPQSPPGVVYFSGPGCPLSAALLPTTPTAETAMTCPAGVSGLLLSFRDVRGQTMAGEEVLLRGPTGAVVPREVVATHLAALGLPSVLATDGRKALLYLAPGSYEVYSAAEANEDTIRQGLPNGFLGRVELSAGSTAELEVVVSTPESH
jgi:hypothetical protein